MPMTVRRRIKLGIDVVPNFDVRSYPRDSLARGFAKHERIVVPVQLSDAKSIRHVAAQL
jgi:hypothetical protein